ncbi:hypothetical protein C900_00211 [Fulvivirga imtechensis AK7]|uniref:SusD/RagB family nutrient-binding outer membrane lipoprotein n=1 Tax=Fulvivirga imtechensis AK7 TaxID=1237149 RepID=L8JK20_9BACT|nr:SusD/RagB family nutrient-binding outer membrane lipoprotein [Fulvivirga imtechensis]ELR68608.1 hypothetical protein C900_00211 [Fulvivirga imtechensis AK7]
MKKFIIPLAFVVAACSDFGDKNVDPNNPTQVPVAGFLTDAISDMPGMESTATSLYYSQYWSATRYTEASRYSVTQFDFTGIYSGPLNNLQKVIDMNTDPETRVFAAESGSNANQIAVAKILKAYFFLHATDRWGDLPYSEALRGAENLTPVYDPQSAIYSSIAEELDDVIEEFDNGAAPKGDILYNGDISKWRKFANSLRLKMALRISKVAPDKAKTEFEAAVADGTFTSNNDNAIFNYLGNGAFDNPWHIAFLTRTDNAVSEPLVDMLLDLNDPRLQAYADPINPGQPDVYAGMPYGLGNGEAGGYGFEEVSLPNSSKVIGKDSSIPILTYAQVLFYLAEGAANGWNAGGTAEEYYNEAIKASMEQWGVFDQPSYDSYITQPAAAFDASNATQLIGEQKWIATYMQGYEAWAEWRRLGYPDLQPAPAAVNNSGQIPRRQAYPASESQNNKANYDKAVARQGTDNLDTRVWWDVE